ncbi:MAG: single-stranded DNA-binding protein [Candidatus Omnitrophota bacterium]
MASLNKVFLIGNLTRDPELRYVPSGAPVATFGLAVNRRYVMQSGEKKDEVCFVRIVVFGKQAESCSQHLSKGRLIFVEGRLQYRSWEQEGQKRSTLDIIADRVQFLGSPKPQGQEQEESMDSMKEVEIKTDEEVPF